MTVVPYKSDPDLTLSHYHRGGPIKPRMPARMNLMDI